MAEGREDVGVLVAAEAIGVGDHGVDGGAEPPVARRRRKGTGQVNGGAARARRAAELLLPERGIAGMVA